MSHLDPHKTVEIFLEFVTLSPQTHQSPQSHHLSPEIKAIYGKNATTTSNYNRLINNSTTIYPAAKGLSFFVVFYQSS